LTRWSQVTHYYFDDCIYYTPAFSDEAVGRLQLRDPVSVSDGRLRPSKYLGELVNMDSKMPRGLSFPRAILNGLSGLRGKYFVER